MTVSKDHYYRLASEVPKERIEAATSLLSELIESNTKEDWDYALNRLLKGLITSRQSARFGFSMALTEVLLELIKKDSDGYEDITIDYYLDLLLKTTQLASSMKGKEERSVLFGRLFGLQVLINTKLLYHSDNCQDHSLFKFINCIIELSNLKSWLRETTIFTLHQFVKVFLSQESNHSKELKDNVIVTVLQVTNDQGLNLSSEGVAIYLSIPKEQRSKLASHISHEKSNWKNGDPFTRGNLPLLAKALKDVEVVDPESDPVNDKSQKGKNSKQKGNWSPRIPFVWDLIVQEFNSAGHESEETSIENSKKRKKSSYNDTKKKKHSSSSSSSAEPADITVQEFWKVVIDDSFYSEKSSHERKFWGFEIFIKFLKELSNIDSIQYLFTQNFMRCLVNQSAQANRMLHKISSKALKTITDEAQSNPEKVPVIFNRLIDENIGGSWNFDLITKSKTVDALLTIKGNQQVITNLKTLLIQAFNTALESQEDIDNNTTKKSNDNKIKWSLDKLLVLIRRNLNTIDAKDIEDITKLLIRQTFFYSSDQSQVSENVKSACQERLNSILADIINLKRQDAISWAYYCLKYIFKLEESSKFKNLIDFDEELLAVKQETAVILKSISELMAITKSEAKKDQLHCFELLYSMVLIQMYMGDDEAVQVINELNLCYENTFSDEAEEGIDTSVVLTEIILSFISRKSNLLKKLAFTVWEFFICAEDQSGQLRLNEASLQLLYDVLYSRENKEGQQKLFEGADEMVEEEDEDDEDEKDDEDDDVEEEEDDEEEDNEEEDEENSDSVDEDSEDDNVSNDQDKLAELDKETNLKLAKALGIPTAESGEVKFDDLDSSDDEEYESDSMDDEQMMAMDDQLSKIFKERQDILSNISTGNKRKAEVIEAKEHMIFFKNRILDLLEILNRVQPNSLLNLTAIKPIITMINLTLNKELGVKAHKLLKTKLNRTKIILEDVERHYHSKEELDSYKDSLLALISDLQGELNSKKSTSQGHSLACNQACIIISKNLVAIDATYLERIIEIYATSLKNWAANPKSNIQPSLFFDFINWLNSKR